MTTPRNRTIATSLATIAVMGAVAGAQYPTKPPVPAPLKAASFPPYQEATLANGVHLVVVENHRAPVVSISLSMPAGEIYDPPAKEGVASMAATLLTKGAGTRSADDIAEAIEQVGGSIESSANLDFATVRADALSANAPLAFQLIGDAVARPTFADKEIELLRTQTLSGLQLEQADPASIASRAFATAVYGSGPYARHETPATVRAITRADLVAFQNAHLKPHGALLVVAGDINLARARTLATQALAGWTGAPTGNVAIPTPSAHPNPEIILVHRPGSVQSNIYVGGATFAPSDPRAYALRVGSWLMGGGPQSRLFLIVREQKSYAYDAHTETARPRGIGTFRAVTQVRTDVTDSALAEVLAQLKRLQTEPVPATELDAAKNALVGQFPLTIETAEQVASAVSNQKLLGLPANYLQTVRTRLAAVTAPEVQSVAKSVMGPSVIVVVGDATKVYDKLTKIAPVKLQSVDGTPMSPGDLVVKAASLTIDPSKIRIASDSFDVALTQGGQSRSVGFEKMDVARSGSDFVYTENVSIPLAGLNQNTIVTFAPSLVVKEIKQTGAVQGQQLSTSIVVTGNRIKGTATTPQASGPKTVKVDTVLAPGVIESNELIALIPSLDLTDNFKLSVNAFDSGTGTFEPVTIRVLGKESTTVPAGTFDTYRIEVSGKQTSNLLVTTAAPHRIVKIVLQSAPLEIRLAK